MKYGGKTSSGWRMRYVLRPIWSDLPYQLKKTENTTLSEQRAMYLCLNVYATVRVRSTEDCSVK